MTSWAPKLVNGRDWLRDKTQMPTLMTRPAQPASHRLPRPEGSAWQGSPPPWDPPGLQPPWLSVRLSPFVLTSSPRTRLGQLIGQCTFSELTGAACDGSPAPRVPLERPQTSLVPTEFPPPC